MSFARQHRMGPYKTLFTTFDYNGSMVLEVLTSF